MADSDDRVLEAVKETGRRTEKAVTDLSIVFRDQQETLIKGFSSIETVLAQSLSRENTGGVTLANLLPMLGAITLLGGFLIGIVMNDIGRVDLAMAEDDLRERMDAGAMSRLQGQFDGVTVYQENEVKHVWKAIDTIAKGREQHDISVRGTNTAQWERIRAMEREVFKEVPSLSVQGLQ